MNTFKKRNEKLGRWLKKSKLGPIISKDPSRAAIIVQWLLVSLYFPLAYISQWIPLLFIILMSWHSGLFYAWREVIRHTTGARPIIGLGALLSTVTTELLKFVFLFSALFDLFGRVTSDGSNYIDGVWPHVYFSAVTITTLGYGNLYPEGTISEILAAIEALVGFLFFAIVAGFSATIIVDRIKTKL